MIVLNKSAPTGSRYILLVEHTRTALHVFDDIRTQGLRVLYLGQDPALQHASDAYIAVNPITEYDDLIRTCLDELRNADIAGVLTFSEHHRFATNDIAEKLGHPHLTSEVLRLGRDKHAMRQRMKEGGLPTPNFVFLPDDSSRVSPPLPFPFIVKPNLGFASGGVQLVATDIDFQRAVRGVRLLNRFALARTADVASGILCEEYIDGPEVSVDSLTVDGRTEVFCVCSRGFVSGHNFQDYIYVTPPRLDRNLSLMLGQRVSELLSLYGYSHGPAHTECRFDKKRSEWVVLETAFRVGFGGNIGLLQKAVAGVPYNQLAIKALMRKLSCEELRNAQRAAARWGVLFTPATGRGGVVSRVGGMDWLQTNPQIISWYIAKDIGENVVPYPKGVEYLGYVLGCASSADELDILIAEIKQRVVIVYASDVSDC